MRVVCVNYYYDRALTSPQDLLARYETLTGFAEGLTAAGAEVCVVQRYAHDAEVIWKDVVYRFVGDPIGRAGSLWDRSVRINRAVLEERPDIIHANGLRFARQAARLKRLCGRTPLVVQDHADALPRRRMARRLQRNALANIDAVSFAARDLARPWIESGLLASDKPVFEIMEGSSRFCLRSRESARARTGLAGDPLCLWVGRLNANKDPLTILEGFSLAQERLLRARLAMVYDEENLLPDVRRWLHAHPDTAAHVSLLGSMPHAALETVFNSADLFVLGSRSEGSGYAMLEALSCGVVPVVSDIPSFRALTDNGTIGGLWQVGDAAALAEQLVRWSQKRGPEVSMRVRAFFDERFSFEAIGRQAVTAYAGLLDGASA